MSVVSVSDSLRVSDLGIRQSAVRSTVCGDKTGLVVGAPGVVLDCYVTGSVNAKTSSTVFNELVVVNHGSVR